MMTNNRESRPEITPAETSRCFFCDSADLTTGTHQEHVVFETIQSVVSTEISIPVTVCRSCGAASTNAGAEDLRTLSVETARRKRIADELTKMREKSGLSRSEWLQLTKFGDASLTRWETASGEPTTAYSRYLFLLQHPENLRRLQEKERRDEICRAAFYRDEAYRVSSTPEKPSEAMRDLFPGSTFTQSDVDRADAFCLIPSEEAA